MYKSIVIKKKTDDYLMNEALNEMIRFNPQWEPIKHKLSRDFIINHIIHRYVKI